MAEREAPAELPEVTMSESAGVRYLHLGTPWIQGAMRIDAPLEIELEYVRRMMVWMLSRRRAWPARTRSSSASAPARSPLLRAGG